MKCQTLPLAVPSQLEAPEIAGIEPVLGTEAARILEAGLLGQLIASLGSPLNVLFPERVTQNVSPFLPTLLTWRESCVVYDAHFEDLRVAVGQLVHRETVLGVVGSSGRSTGPHLHFEVRVAGTPVDPSWVF